MRALYIISVGRVLGFKVLLVCMIQLLMVHTGKYSKCQTTASVFYTTASAEDSTATRILLLEYIILLLKR
jgi:hypothetical protein